MAAAAIAALTTDGTAAAGVAAGIGNKIREINPVGGEISAGIAAGIAGMTVIAGH